MQDGQDGTKLERKSRNISNQNTKNQKTKIWGEQNTSEYILLRTRNQDHWSCSRIGNVFSAAATKALFRL